VADSTALVWFRRDLRLDDNPAWARATSEHERVVALFVIDPALFDAATSRRTDRMLGDLRALDERLATVGGRLRVRTGDPRRIVVDEARAVSAVTVLANADVTPYAAVRDAAVATALSNAGIEWSTEWGTLVHEPGRVRTAAGTLSQVFTPFHRTWARTVWNPWPAPGGAAVSDDPGDGVPAATGAYPTIRPLSGDEARPGEEGALARLEAAAARADDYPEERDLPAIVGTTELSIDLRFGTLSPRTVATVIGDATPGRAAVVRQLAWRDWYAHLLFERPELVDSPMKAQYSRLAWRDDDAGFVAWRTGRTGYPFVDAGVRQLLATGWMHNRVRMVVASFLVKNLLIDWRRGERWFRHVLLDADVAQNVGNWQWVAGTGPDASPYNRVFNPILQGQRFDPGGDYVRRWVPELAGIAGGAVHQPWEIGPLELAAAGVELGVDYPAPIVDLAESRARVLAAYAAARD
jgi:deoxyribodipyrimidine photo-lyase